MIKLGLAIVVSMFLLLSFTVNADVKLEDNSKLLGKWNLYAEAASLHKEKVELFSTWEFTKGGVIHAQAEDRFGRTKTLKLDFKYSVENGVIRKAKAPGRSKMETCRVISLEGDKMTLKCPFVYFFFKR